MNSRQIGASALLRRLRTAAVAAVAILFLVPSAAGAAKPASDECVVRAGGATYGSVQAALDASPAGVTIRVAGTCVGPIVVSKDATIIGASRGRAPKTTLDGGGGATNSLASVVTVEPGASVVVDRLRLTNGYNVFGGAGIHNEGTLLLKHSVVVENNSATGGGIANFSDATVVESVIDHNGTRLGGNIYNEGNLVIRDSTLSRGGGRFGNGLYNAGTALLVRTKVIDDDLVLPLFGGGIENHGDLTLRRSTISGNTSVFGGALLNTGTARLIRSKITGNTAFSGGGGGIMNGPAFSPGTGTERLILIRTEISGNSSSQGGGIYNKGQVILDRHSRIGGNSVSAGGQGGGIYNETGATVTGIRSATFTPANIPDDCFGC